MQKYQKYKEAHGGLSRRKDKLLKRLQQKQDSKYFLDHLYENYPNCKRMLSIFYGMTADLEREVWVDPYTGEVMHPCNYRNYEGDCSVLNKLCPGICPEYEEEGDIND